MDCVVGVKNDLVKAKSFQPLNDEGMIKNKYGNDIKRFANFYTLSVLQQVSVKPLTKFVLFYHFESDQYIVNFLTCNETRLN